MNLTDDNIINLINTVMQGQRLQKCRADSKWYDDLGDFYIVNDRLELVETHVGLVDLARQVGVYDSKAA